MQTIFRKTKITHIYHQQDRLNCKFSPEKDHSLIYLHRSLWIKTHMISFLYDAPKDSQTALAGQEHLICMNLTHSSQKNSRDRWCYETREALRPFTRVHDAISKNSLVQTNTDLETKQFRLPWAHWTSPGALGQSSSSAQWTKKAK